MSQWDLGDSLNAQTSICTEAEDLQLEEEHQNSSLLSEQF